MLQAIESTADQIDHLTEIIHEFLTMGEAGVPMSATTRQRCAAEMADLRAQRAQLLRKTIAAFWAQIGRKHAQYATVSVYAFIFDSRSVSACGRSSREVAQCITVPTETAKMEIPANRGDMNCQAAP